MAESAKRILICWGAAAVILALAGPLATGGPERQAFELGTLRVAPGEAASGTLEVPEKDGQAAFIPVTVLHGLRPGPVLALVAGVHGAEYPPILALYRLKDMIDPKKLAGTAVLVHVANIPSFQKRSIYYVPQDGKNLNRVFPDDPQGTLSQRMAFVLTRDVERHHSLYHIIATPPTSQGEPLFEVGRIKE
jgi:predicted deacylase